MEALKQILENLDWSPLWISLKTGIAATFFSFFSGDFCGGKGYEGRRENKGRAGRYTHAAHGAAPYGSGIFPSADL